jgi:sulfotransferase family protein
VGKKTQIATNVGRAVIDGGLRHRTFADVERFCLFVGFPRSGTTLVGTLLNAHPDLVISQELDALRYVRLGLRRDQLYSMILRRDREFAAAGFQWTGYDYAVPGQYQGRYQRLLVIGDKRAGMTTNRLRERPELIDVLRRTVRVPLRVIHVVRSPFDTAATMARRRQCDLSFAINHYSRLAVTVDQVRTGLDPEELIDFRYEELTAHPEEQLRKLCEFVGVSADPSYLRDCALRVSAGGSRSRDATPWSDADREAVEKVIAQRPVLAGYTMTT